MRMWSPLTQNERLLLPGTITPEERPEWLDFGRRLIECQRHEDGLLNARFQGFMVATAFLMAAVSQFREAKYLPIAGLISLAGLLLSTGAYQILGRTARTIQWYLDVLARLDLLLYPNPSQRLYDSRTKLLGELHTTPSPAKYPVSVLLGVWVPVVVSIIWVVLLLSLWHIHRQLTLH